MQVGRLWSGVGWEVTGSCGACMYGCQWAAAWPAWVKAVRQALHSVHRPNSCVPATTLFPTANDQEIPDFTTIKTFNVLDFGAVGDGQTGTPGWRGLLLLERACMGLLQVDKPCVPADCSGWPPSQACAFHRPAHLPSQTARWRSRRPSMQPHHRTPRA